MNINWKKAGKDIGIWFAELVAIFISVYLAFLLNGYRIHRQDVHKKQQIYTALYRYFSEMGIKKAKKHFENEYVTLFLKPYRKKEMPRLKKPPRLIIFSINDHTWNAMLQTGGIDLLDVKLIRQVNFFFSAVQREKVMINHFNKMTDKYLLPNYNADINTFYNTKTKKLSPPYEWYVNYITFSRDQFNQLESTTERILKMLRKKMNNEQLQKIEADSSG